MAFARADRIGEEVKRILDKLIREEVRDARVGGTSSITRVEVTRDLRWAKVRFSVLEPERRKPMLEALKSAAGFLRHRLGQEMSLRYSPELLFEVDENIEYGAHIADLLKKIAPSDPDKADEPMDEYDDDVSDDDETEADISDGE